VLQPLHPGHALGLAHAAFKGGVVAALLNGEAYCCLEKGIGAKSELLYGLGDGVTLLDVCPFLVATFKEGSIRRAARTR
jgi:hypothetical protein